MRIMTTVTFLGMVFAGYMIYCLIRYVNIAFPGEVLSIWVSAILGGVTMSLLWNLILIAVGHPVPPNKPDSQPQS